MASPTGTAEEPKYRLIERDLRRRIDCGELTDGDRLPGEVELAQQHGVHRFTARKAMGELVRDGLLRRVRGQGTFVTARPSSETFDATSCVAICIRTQGHFFEAETLHLVRALQAGGQYSLMIDLPESFDTGAMDRQVCRRIAQALESGVQAVVIDGRNVRELKRAFPDISKLDNVIVINQLFFPLEDYDVDAHRVLCDFEAAGSMAAAHLLDQGHRRLAFVTYPDIVRPEQPIRFSNHLCQHQYVRGVRKALALRGLDPQADLEIVYHVEKMPDISHESMTGLLRQQDHPTGFLAVSDSRARVVYQAAAELGLSIPDDLAVVGFWNTPWATVYSPQLTSVSASESLIAEEVARLVGTLADNPKLEKQAIDISPRLVIRESSIKPS